MGAHSWGAHPQRVREHSYNHRRGGGARPREGGHPYNTQGHFAQGNPATSGGHPTNPALPGDRAPGRTRGLPRAPAAHPPPPPPPGGHRRPRTSCPCRGTRGQPRVCQHGFPEPRRLRWRRATPPGKEEAPLRSALGTERRPPPLRDPPLPGSPGPHLAPRTSPRRCRPGPSRPRGRPRYRVGRTRGSQGGGKSKTGGSVRLPPAAPNKARSPGERGPAPGPAAAVRALGGPPGPRCPPPPRVGGRRGGLPGLTWGWSCSRRRCGARPPPPPSTAPAGAPTGAPPGPPAAAPCAPPVRSAGLRAPPAPGP